MKNEPYHTAITEMRARGEWRMREAEKFDLAGCSKIPPARPQPMKVPEA
jgi:hypothetical protein